MIHLKGGTTDITVHQKIGQSKLKELCRASGGDCGGTSVDNDFSQLLIKLVGAPVLTALKQKDPSAYLFIYREFEAIKRTIDTSAQGGFINMSIPRAILDEICKKHLGEDFAAVIEASTYKGKIEVRYDKMRFDKNLIVGMLMKSSQKIIQLIKDTLTEVKNCEVSVILLVGGFSECKLIQQNTKQSFPNIRVIVPEDAELAIVKGAVLFGHKPEYIVSRVVRYTYGIKTKRDFDPRIHKPSQRIIVKGKPKCAVIFKIFVTIGTNVQLGSQITKELSVTELQSKVNFRVYQSTSECPEYVDEEDCVHLGKLTVNITNPSEEKRYFRVNLIFGLTELKVSANDIKTGQEYETTLDLI